MRAETEAKKYVSSHSSASRPCIYSTWKLVKKFKTKY